MMLNKDFWQLGVWFCFLIIFPVTVRADTLVSGLILFDTIWTKSESPYLVTQSILVNQEVTLSIEPGVVVKFDDGNSLQINGTLLAKGTLTEPIKFTNHTGNNWGYILFADSSMDAQYDNNDGYINGSIMEYCIVEYGGGNVINESGTIRMNNSHPFIHQCTIRNNSSVGIHGWDLSQNLKIIKNTIIDNVDTSSTDAAGGIWVEGGNVTIHSNFINNNIARRGGGIHASRNTLAEIINNTITNNSGRTGGGIYLYSGTATVNQNIIMNNNAILTGSAQEYGGGIHIWFTTATISNNLIGQNNAIRAGGGIYQNWQWGQNVFSSIHNNIIVENQSALGAGMGVFSGDTDIPISIQNNAILRNIGNSGSGFYYEKRLNQPFANNLITGNKAKTNTGTDNAIFVTALPVINNNNIFNNNNSYELWNDNPEGSPDVNAEINFWGTQLESEVEAMIYHWVDNSTKGVADYLPLMKSPHTDPPISPPTGISAVPGNGEIALSWAANPEGDTTGYRVFWGTTPGFPYANAANVGNTTSYTITGLTPGIYYISITAYDTHYNAANDVPETIVNDNQTNGIESWYAVDVEVIIGQKITIAPIDYNFSDTVIGDSSSPVEFVISNVGSAVLDITDMTISNSIDFTLDVNGGSNPCKSKSLSIPAGENRTVSIQFNPLSRGLKQSDFTIVSNDLSTPNSSIFISGLGTSENIDISGIVGLTIAGHTNLSVKNATISLKGTDFSTKTNDNGEFIFLDVPPDTYTLVVTAQNLKTISKTITLSPWQDFNLVLPNMTVLTDDDLDQARLDERKKWDVNNDGKVGLDEAIHALNVITGEMVE